jgi:folate-binding protein YgfZ
MADAETPLFFDLSHLRKVLVAGPDAGKWLNDLTSADIGSLVPGEAGRSLLLSPTGRVRAEFTVAATGEGYLLMQDPEQRPIDQLLSPYTLSSDVSLADRTEALALFAILASTEPPPIEGVLASTPSWTGRGGDICGPAELRDQMDDWLAAHLPRGSAEELERLRIASGRSRLGSEATEEDLPEEAGMGDAVAFDKGCYLGQEAVAKVRNLGHPRRLIMAFEASKAVVRGEGLTVEGRDAGLVTSVATVGNTSLLLARVKWDERAGPFRTSGGASLKPRREP